MNNYYEILEVSKNASKEVIEKAYKVLAKKYHPDLQEEENKAKAEQRMKLINEAYEVLSDDIRKKQYDIQLEEELKLQMQEELNRINSQSKANQPNNNYEYEINQENNSYTNNNDYESDYQLTKQEIKNLKKEERKAQKKYQEQNERIYRNYLRSLGYHVKEKWTLKKVVKLLEIFGIIIIICIILWFFPPTHKMLVETYENNKIIKIIVDIISKIVVGLVQGIGNFFKVIVSKK